MEVHSGKSLVVIMNSIIKKGPHALVAVNRCSAHTEATTVPKSLILDHHKTALCNNCICKCVLLRAAYSAPHTHTHFGFCILPLLQKRDTLLLSVPQHPHYFSSNAGGKFKPYSI